jgi:hypothetical protein
MENKGNRKCQLFFIEEKVEAVDSGKRKGDVAKRIWYNFFYMICETPAEKDEECFL